MLPNSHALAIDSFRRPAYQSTNNQKKHVFTGVMLRLSPSEAIHFVKSGSDMVGTVDITNIVQQPVTYKIKTTSPDKFRVRPSSGVLAPGANTSINVVLLQGPNNTQATIVKDKFLVMCMELAPDASTSTQDITELWKVSGHCCRFVRTFVVNQPF